MSDIIPKTRDRDLLDRSIAGERDAREELARICLARVRRTIFLVSPGVGDMDDIVQIALVRIFKKLHTVRNRDAFFPWVDKIAVNTVREHFRRGLLDRFLPFAKNPDDLPSAAAGDPARRTENRRLIDRVAAHLSGIRPKKRTALVLSMAHGYSTSEIAQLTGCSQETAKKRLQHGRRELLNKARKDQYLRRVFQEIER